MMTNHFQPSILEPTRLTLGNKPSLIDNIFVNSIEKEVYSGNLVDKLSDHLPQFIFVKDILHKPTIKKRVKKDFSNFSEEAFKRDVKDIHINLSRFLVQ